MSSEITAWPTGKWAKGTSGNPGGLPHGTPKVSVALMRLLRTPVTEEFQVVTRADALAMRLYYSAIAGDISAIKETIDRTEGRPSQSLQVAVSQMPTTEIVTRLVDAFSELGLEEETTRRVLLQLAAGDDD
jgi:hypothetical protein